MRFHLSSASGVFAYLVICLYLSIKYLHSLAVSVALCFIDNINLHTLCLWPSKTLSRDKLAVLLLFIYNWTHSKFVTQMWFQKWHKLPLFQRRLVCSLVYFVYMHFKIDAAIQQKCRCNSFNSLLHFVINMIELCVFMWNLKIYFILSSVRVINWIKFKWLNECDWKYRGNWSHQSIRVCCWMCHTEKCAPPLLLLMLQCHKVFTI